MWPFSRKSPKIQCFFCNIEVDKKEAFVLQYNAKDGTGSVNMCPICAGMIDDMGKAMKDVYND